MRMAAIALRRLVTHVLTLFWYCVSEMLRITRSGVVENTVHGVQSTGLPTPVQLVWTGALQPAPFGSAQTLRCPPDQNRICHLPSTIWLRNCVVSCHMSDCEKPRISVHWNS
jgi:hypothetical protein